MSTQSPAPFPERGRRALSAQKSMQRVAAIACPQRQRHTPLRARLAQHLFALSALLLLTACEPEKANIGYLGVNHTDDEVVSFSINGEGGILNVPAQGGGGKIVCCVTVPKRWHPGMTVTIRWRLDGSWLLDEQGREVIRDGKRVYVPAPTKEKTVPIPEYLGENPEHFDVHFFPNEEVKVLVGGMKMPEHRDYPIPYPEPKNSQR